MKAIITLLILAITSYPGGSEKIKIHTTFYPTKYMAERITGDLALVVNQVPASEDPIFWQPSRKDIMAYHNADIILLNGAKFEKWVDKATLPGDKIIITAKSFENEFITYETAVTHSHGGGKKHSHEGMDGHTWVDPVNFIRQAETVKNGLVKKFPTHKKIFEAGFKKLKGDFESLNKLFLNICKIKNPPPMLMSHPAYNYIAKLYGWKIHNLDLDPGEMLDQEAMANIESINKTFKSKYLIWESEPKKEISEKLQKDLGLKSLVFSPCEQMEDSELKNGNNYLKVMLQNLEVITQVYSGK